MQCILDGYGQPKQGTDLITVCEGLVGSVRRRACLFKFLGNNRVEFGIDPFDCCFDFPVDVSDPNMEKMKYADADLLAKPGGLN